MKKQFYHAAISKCSGQSPNQRSNLRFLTFIAGTALAWALAVTDLHAQTSYGSITGTAYDTYVINSDNTNFWTYLRLQTFNNRGWNMVNKGDFLWWGLAKNATHSDPGTEMMRLADPGDLQLARNIQWGGNGDSFGLLSFDQGASIKLRGQINATPYIDFVNDPNSDFDLRFIQTDKSTLRFQKMITDADAVLDVWGAVRPRSIQVGNNPHGALEVNGNIQISTATIPMGLTTEVGGTTPLLNLDVNFRQINKKIAYRGASFRIDTRDYALFQWNSRKAGATQESKLMELRDNGDLIMFGDGSTTGGNLGIGTSNPTKGRLQVVGSFHVENTEGKQTFHVSAGKQLVFVGDSAYIQYQASLNQPESPIQQDQFSLWVSKGVVTEDIALVNAGAWADYVFSNDYKMLSLTEVESYIREHGHLPEMPSEQEVKQRGYSVHDINRRLLQKIEELTLHAIEQEKKIQTLQQENSGYQDLATRLSALELRINK